MYPSSTLLLTTRGTFHIRANPSNNTRQPTVYSTNFQAVWGTLLLSGCRNGQIRELFPSSTRSKPSEGSGSHATSALQAYLKPRQRATTALTRLSIRSNRLAYVILTRQSMGCRCKNIRRRDGGLNGRILAQIQGKSTDRRYGRLHPSEGLGITIP